MKTYSLSFRNILDCMIRINESVKFQFKSKLWNYVILFICIYSARPYIVKNLGLLDSF